jgi:medium-chain acyl-[acyl-carrier-protein] hydrolase
VTNSWIVYPQPNPQASIRLFCFPYAGAGASIFRAWATQLPPEIEVCAIQLPGRETRIREPLFTQLAPLLQSLIPTLLPHLNRPFAFFGHSLGSVICFEVARHLHKIKHTSPLHLFFSARQAPGKPDLHPPIHQLPDTQFLDELRRFNGTPESVLQNVEFMRFFLPILRADLAIAETYTYEPQPPLDCPISVFGGLEDKVTSPDFFDTWQEQTNGSFRVQMFPGDHFFLRSQQQKVLHAILCDLEHTLIEKSSFNSAIA